MKFRKNGIWLRPVMRRTGISFHAFEVDRVRCPKYLSLFQLMFQHNSECRFGRETKCLFLRCLHAQSLSLQRMFLLPAAFHPQSCIGEIGPLFCGVQVPWAVSSQNTYG